MTSVQFCLKYHTKSKTNNTMSYMQNQQHLFKLDFRHGKNNSDSIKEFLCEYQFIVVCIAFSLFLYLLVSWWEHEAVTV